MSLVDRAAYRPPNVYPIETPRKVLVEEPAFRPALKRKTERLQPLSNATTGPEGLGRDRLTRPWKALFHGQYKNRLYVSR